MIFFKADANKKVLISTKSSRYAAFLKLPSACEDDGLEKAYDGFWYVKGFAPSKPQKLINDERVAYLKKMLADSDYKAIKFAEGLISVEEYAETKTLRQSWREELNKLGV